MTSNTLQPYDNTLSYEVLSENTFITLDDYISSESSVPMFRFGSVQVRFGSVKFRFGSVQFFLCNRTEPNLNL